MSGIKDLLENAVKNRFIISFEYDTLKDFVDIGSGAFGQVTRAYSNSLEKYVALKSLKSLNNEEEFAAFVKELRNFNTVNHHDNIIQFLGISKDPKETYYLVLQYAEGGDLRTYLQKNFETLDWETKISMAKDIARGLNFIHNADIVHRDLHSKNILVHQKRLLITDLGLSKSLDTDSKSVIGGVLAYTDPEWIRNMRKGYKRNKASDVYSIGVLFWELSSGRPPFKDFQLFEISDKVKSGEREKPINGTPVDYVNIYSSAWNDNPTQRPTVENIRNSLGKIQFENIFYVSNENTKSIQPKVIIIDEHSQDLVSNASDWDQSNENINLSREVNDQTLTDFASQEITGIDN
ncbi:hypothetical protein Glove_326g23 [Diversispora epigaea]|uniref:Protein kinase domain-containing protein n=1 Tax=Diversispora epigaea TaxID=1348612 RepID=A0A397HSM3_9GLOM|nr:hypothetical protein Glove_326g23 [Diversispora epigaea]